MDNSQPQKKKSGNTMLYLMILVGSLVGIISIVLLVVAVIKLSGEDDGSKKSEETAQSSSSSSSSEEDEKEPEEESSSSSNGDETASTLDKICSGETTDSYVKFSYINKGDTQNYTDTSICITSNKYLIKTETFSSVDSKKEERDEEFLNSNKSDSKLLQNLIDKIDDSHVPRPANFNLQRILGTCNKSLVITLKGKSFNVTNSTSFEGKISEKKFDCGNTLAWDNSEINVQKILDFAITSTKGDLNQSLKDMSSEFANAQFIKETNALYDVATAFENYNKKYKSYPEQKNVQLTNGVVQIKSPAGSVETSVDLNDKIESDKICFISDAKSYGLELKLEYFEGVGEQIFKLGNSTKSCQ